jgi:hypothetical protein
VYVCIVVMRIRAISTHTTARAPVMRRRCTTWEGPACTCAPAGEDVCVCTSLSLSLSLKHTHALTRRERKDAPGASLVSSSTSQLADTQFSMAEQVCVCVCDYPCTHS